MGSPLTGNPLPREGHVVYKLDWDLVSYVGKHQCKTNDSEVRSFEEARAYVRTLGLTSKKAWKKWSKSGDRPNDIPSNPDTYYASSGWASFPDFLGYAARSFLNFEDARAYVRTLGLTSWKDWQAWSVSGKRPRDIPSSPHKTYESSGWTSYPDFVGYA
ncbi:hypothetical protein RI054_08g44450 [Pseudoscourfieldia marina]